MPAPDPIETVLARLMPPALSQECQDGLDAMIDDLAGPEKSLTASAIRGTGRWLLIGGMAAAVGAMFAIFPLPGDAPLQQSAGVPAVDPPSGLVLLSESDRVESMTDEGWQEDATGSALHALRLNMVEENQLIDEETGMQMRISEPREEVLLVPISEF
ncbi:MAG: hypothetical protein V4640_12125 [Verrucomicrobiota bacterium]